MFIKPVKHVLVAAFVFFVLASTVLFAPTSTKVSPKTVQAAPVPPVWLTPVVDLIKYMVDRFKPNRDQQKEMVSKTTAIDAEAQQLAPFPRFLEDSRPFRVAAIELAQTIRVGARNEALADRLWEVIKVEYDDTNKAFETAFKPEPIRNLITAAADLQSAENQCSTSLAQIRRELKPVSSTPATPKEKQDALNRLLSSVNPLTQGAQTPEYVMVQASEGVVKRYAQLATDLRRSSSPQRGSASQPSARNPNSRILLSVAYPFAEQRGGMRSEEPNSEQPDFLKQMHEDIQKPVEPPAWSLLLVENAAPSSPSFWLSNRTVGGFGGGLLVGFGALALLIRFQPYVLQRIGLLK
jgi:hypothetical protein